MKNKIQALAESCNHEIFGVNGELLATHFDSDKFAMLIAGECARIVAEVQPGYRDYRSQIEEAMRDDCVSAINEAFRFGE